MLAETIAEHTFRGRDVSALPLGWTGAGRRLWRCLITLLTDSKYSSANLEASLKAVFGEARTLSDWTVANEMGLHVGMPVTTVEDTATFVATNDGGAGNPEDTVGTSFPLSQAARRTAVTDMHCASRLPSFPAIQERASLASVRYQPWPQAPIC